MRVDNNPKGDGQPPGRHKPLWTLAGVGCVAVLGYACYLLVVFAWTGFSVARATGNFFVSPTRNSERFLEAVAQDDLTRALRFVHPAAANNLEELQEVLPEEMLNIASVGEETYSRFAGNGDGRIIYRVTMDDGTTAQVGLSMDIRSSEWLVSSVGLYDDE